MKYFEILERAGKILHEKRFKRVHIFGVGKFNLLVRSYLILRKYGIETSYDTSTYEINGVHGSLFNPYDFRLTQIFSKDKKYQLYHPAEIALLNIKIINQFWENLNKLYPI